SVVPAAARRAVRLDLDGELAAVAQPQHDAAVRGHEAGAGERHDLVDLDRGALRRLSPGCASSSAGESNPVFPGPKPGPVTVPSHSMCEGVAVCSLAAYHTQTVLARSIAMSSATTPRCSSHRGLPFASHLLWSCQRGTKSIPACGDQARVRGVEPRPTVLETAVLP